MKSFKNFLLESSISAKIQKNAHGPYDEVDHKKDVEFINANKHFKNVAAIFMNDETSKGYDSKTKKLHSILKKHYSYTPEEHAVLREHGKTSNRAVKVYGRDGKQLPRNSKEIRNSVHINTEKIINNHTTPKDLTVYHGVSRGWRTLLGIGRKLGIKKIPLPYKLSTSLNVDTAREFSHEFGDRKVRHRHVLVMHVPKGTKSAYIGHLKDVGEPIEQEMLLNKGNFHIHHTQTFHSPIHGKTSYHYGTYVPKKE